MRWWSVLEMGRSAATANLLLWFASGRVS